MEMLFSLVLSAVPFQVGATFDPRAYTMIAAGFLAALVIRKRAI